ncbi:hypothetical protein SAMN06297144_2340 [Sphingomonas guangdongensis]|uniref:Uncharacterized protein n=1 Tax=Sphingomonas guangdongensis TaxID=1141890 RepID=A0A285QZF0_9SPHN|nr:hypothetical protein [Sphingomonas guangdongensis]SOB87216.1 hypothetical protein SAMN06297144_2340 [Sphingomonas guangdongensis]
MKRATLLAAALLCATPASAGWKLVPAGTPIAVAKSSMSVRPGEAWNRSTERPSKRGETWTLDGVALSDLSFYAAVPPGEAIFRERDKKDEPLPRVAAGMLPTDIVAAVEGSYRILLRTSLFEVEEVAPATLGGHKGVRFTYRFTTQDDEVRRRGEALAALVGGRLYLMTFDAPAIHYFDARIAAARAVMDSAVIPAASVEVTR